MYNEPYSLSDPPSDQFPFFRRDEDEECEYTAAEPTQGPNRAEHVVNGTVMHTGQPKYIKGVAKKKYNLLAKF